MHYIGVRELLISIRFSLALKHLVLSYGKGRSEIAEASRHFGREAGFKGRRVNSMMITPSFHRSIDRCAGVGLTRQKSSSERTHHRRPLNAAPVVLYEYLRHRQGQNLKIAAREAPTSRKKGHLPLPLRTSADIFAELGDGSQYKSDLVFKGIVTIVTSLGAFYVFQLSGGARGKPIRQETR